MARVAVTMALCAALLMGVALAANPLGPYNIDPSRVTVGGLSSGAFMAVQMHVAFSSTFKGASIFAGGPYYCAQGSESTATTTCMDPNEIFPPPKASALASITRLAADAGEIDGVGNLTDARVYIYSGALDTIVHKPVVNALVDYYKIFTTGGSIATEFSVLAEHCYPTLNYGEICELAMDPYIGKCNFDGAGAGLKQLYGTLKPKGTQQSSNLMQFSQNAFAPNNDPGSISMNSIGFIYVPTACQSGASCGVHMSYHGCDQSTSDIQEQYPQHVGLNEWAETNNIIVLYPQVVHDDLLGNFEGCWDWWGYTGSNYAQRTGKQMETTFKMLQAITKSA